MDWPNGFLKFIDDYAKFQSTFRDYGRNSLGNLYFQWLRDKWLGKEFDFVHLAFKQYLLTPNRQYIPKIIHKYSLWDENFIHNYMHVTCTEAAKILKVTPATVKKLVERKKLEQYYQATGSLSTLSSSHQSRNYLLLEREEVLALRDKWENTFTMEEVKQKLGISKNTIIELAKLETIIAERGPIADGSSIWLFSKVSVNKFLCQIEKRLCSKDKGYLDMKSALNILRPLGIKSAAILDFGINEKINMARAEGMAGLENLLFNAADIRIIKGKLETRNGWIESRDVSCFLGVGDSVLS